MDPATTWAFFAPFEPSPTVWLVCGLTLGLLVLGGLRRCRLGHPPGPATVLAFLLGLELIYAALQTQYDYYSQHMFFLHRLQHLVLHHLAPFLASPTAATSAPPPWRHSPSPSGT